MKAAEQGVRSLSRSRAEVSSPTRPRFSSSGVGGYTLRMIGGVGMASYGND